VKYSFTSCYNRLTMWWMLIVTSAQVTGGKQARGRGCNMRRHLKFYLCAGVSAIAISAATPAQADLFTTPGVVVGGYTTTTAGIYEIFVSGAQGGGDQGGLGALVGGSFYLAASVTLDLLVGGQGAGPAPGFAGSGGGAVASSVARATPCLP